MDYDLSVFFYQSFPKIKKNDVLGGDQKIPLMKLNFRFLLFGVNF